VKNWKCPSWTTKERNFSSKYFQRPRVTFGEWIWVCWKSIFPKTKLLNHVNNRMKV
jgi:hypothetical protein